MRIELTTNDQLPWIVKHYITDKACKLENYFVELNMEIWIWSNKKKYAFCMYLAKFIFGYKDSMVQNLQKIVPNNICFHCLMSH